MTSLLVMVPVRKRRMQAERLLKSFTENTDNAEMIFISDADDAETYADMDWGPAAHVVLDPRMPISGKFNRVAETFAGDYDALFGVGDDNLFCTPHWDTIMLSALEDMGGTGWVYPDCQRRDDIPEISMVSTDITRALGWFNNPVQAHYYADNAVAELGKHANLLRYCPEVLVKHLHYDVCPETERDELYRETERLWGASDLAAYRKWHAEVMPFQVAMLRRMFNPDVQWILGKV